MLFCVLPFSVNAEVLTKEVNVLESIQDSEFLQSKTNEILALLKDKELVLKAVSQNGLDVKFAHPDLHKNFDMMLKAVSQNGLALRYASEELKGNEQIVRAAVMQKRSSFEFASKQRKDDADMVLAGGSLRICK